MRLDVSQLTDTQRADVEAHVRGLTPGPETYERPAHGWTCFHCGETFHTLGGARLHFGGGPDEPAACLAGGDLRPAWEGQFDTFGQWVAWASSWLTGRTGSVGEPLPAICVDAKGRRCHVGKDFMRARDEDAFPVRFFWECKAP